MPKKKFRFDIFQAQDVETRVNVLNSPSVMAGITIDVPVTIENTTNWARSLNENKNRRDFVLRDQHETAIAFSGLVNILHKHATAELYAFVAEPNQGKGIGHLLLDCTLKYAADELNLRKISLYVTEGNDNAINLYERIGFQLEGCLKKHSWHRGQYRDRYIYSIFLANLKVDLNIYSYLQ